MKIDYQEAFDSFRNRDIGSRSALVGFDAVLDHLVRPVRSEGEAGDELFSTIGEFGDYLRAKAGMSCCIQLRTVRRKVGGNMAILSLALSSLGVRTTCVGAAGGEEGPVYQALAEVCEVYSVAPCGNCTALEFQDGKVMLADTEAMLVTWEEIVGALGEDALRALLRRSDLVCFVNWSELRHAGAIWRGMLDLAAREPSVAGRPAFIDLADISTRTRGDIEACVGLLRDFSGYFSTTLGLNENEAAHLGRTLGVGDGDIYAAGERIRRAAGVETVVIHTNTYAYAFGGDGVREGAAFVHEAPLALTGAGDNFNAGFCIGRLLGLDTGACVLLGNAGSGYYVRHGESTDFEGLKAFVAAQLAKGGSES